VTRPRQKAAAGGEAALNVPARGRLHEPLPLTAHGALAVATFAALAALAAIVLVSLAVVAGSRREDARRREAQAMARAADAQTRAGAASERLAG
jgi:hypothetical protein